MFDKGYMVGIEDTVSGGVPKAVRLGIGGITDEDTRNRTMKYLRVVGGYESVRSTTNLTQV